MGSQSVEQECSPERESMLADVAKSKACRFVNRGSRRDLIHSGRTPAKKMQARLAHFLRKHPGHEQRAVDQAHRDIVERYRKWYGTP